MKKENRVKCVFTGTSGRLRKGGESVENTPPLSEPAVAYKKSSITTFNSFEEINKADAQSAAHTAPLDHLKNTTERIKKIYADELKTTFDKKIKRR